MNFIIHRFFIDKGFNPYIHDINKASDLFEKSSLYDMSNFATFHKSFTFIFDEQFLEDIYFQLFYTYIKFPHQISRKDFRNIKELKKKCSIVYKSIPKNALSIFNIYFQGFIIIYLADKKKIKILKQLDIMDGDTLSIVKKFIHI